MVGYAVSLRNLQLSNARMVPSGAPVKTDEADVLFLKSLLKDASLPVHGRAMAGALGGMLLDGAKRQAEALKCCKRVLELTISKKERACPAAPPSLGMPRSPRTAGQEFDHWVQDARNLLARWAQPQSNLRNSMPPVPPELGICAEAAALLFASYSKVPGSACDGCGASCSEPGVKLMRCNTCRRNHYCTKQCQV